MRSKMKKGCFSTSLSVIMKRYLFYINFWTKMRRTFITIFSGIYIYISNLNNNPFRFIEKYELFNVCRHTSNFILKSLFVIHEKAKKFFILS